MTAHHDAGAHLCPHCLIRPDYQTTTTRPPAGYGVGDLKPAAIAAVELLLTAATHRPSHVRSGTLSELDALVRLAVMTRVALVLLPPVATLPPHPTDDTCPCMLEDRITATTAQVADLLTEHDAGHDVHPEQLAAAVADLHDAARALWTWTEHHHHDPGTCRCDPGDLEDLL